jgi:hypothetical protein
MQLTISLNSEQLASLQSRVDSFNAVSETQATPESYVASIVMASINGFVEADFNGAVQRLGEAAKAMPFDARIALIQQVESQLAPQ